MRIVDEIYSELRKAVDAQRAMLDKLETEKREFTAEETETYNKIETDLLALENELNAAKKATEERKALSERLSQREASLKTGDKPVDPGGNPEKRSAGPRDTAEYRDMFGRYLRGGPQALMGQEIRALQADSDTGGGYLVAPMQFVAELIKALDNEVFIRGLATKYTVTNAQSLGVPTLDTDLGDVTWTSELGTGALDASMAFGRRELYPHPLARRVKISGKLLRQAALNSEALVLQRLAYKFAVVEENAFLNGTGVGQPLGVFTASANGISTSRDVSTDNTATAIKADNLIECVHTLKPGYLAKARWIFHRDAVKMIRKLKDGEGQYLWTPGLDAARPPSLLGIPYAMSEYAPNTFTAGLYVGILGDFSKYWIADALDVSVQRLVELYAETNQVGFIGRKETDGQPVLEEAFVRVKLG